MQGMNSLNFQDLNNLKIRGKSNIERSSKNEGINRKNLKDDSKNSIFESDKMQSQKATQNYTMMNQDLSLPSDPGGLINGYGINPNINSSLRGVLDQTDQFVSQILSGAIPNTPQSPQAQLQYQQAQQALQQGTLTPGFSPATGIPQGATPIATQNYPGFAQIPNQTATMPGITQTPGAYTLPTQPTVPTTVPYTTQPQTINPQMMIMQFMQQIQQLLTQLQQFMQIPRQ